jgi:hypothetical protein
MAAKFLASSILLLPLTPILVAVAGSLATARLARLRWVVHMSVFAAMFFAALAAVYLQGVFDLSTIHNAGLGDGLILLFYLPVLIISVVLYTVVAFVIRRSGGPEP